MRFDNHQATRWPKISTLGPDVTTRPLSLGSILAFLAENWLGLVISAVIGLALAATYSRIAKPIYRAQAVVILDYQIPVPGGQPLSEATDPGYVDTQIKIIESDDVLRDVVGQLQLDQDPEFVSIPRGLSSKIAAWKTGFEKFVLGAQPPLLDANVSTEVKPADELQQIAVRKLRSVTRATRAARSYVAEIEVTASSSDKSARITNAIARTYVDHQVKFRTEATERLSAPLARIVTPASPFVERAGLKTPVLLAFGVVAGFGVGICIAAARVVTKFTVARRRDLEELGVPCLGLFPQASALKDTRLFPLFFRSRYTSSKRRLSFAAMSYAADFPSSLYCEALRLLKSQITLASVEHQGIVVGVISPVGREGCSTLVANFAQLVARGDEKVLLVDADFRNRQLTQCLAPLTLPFPETFGDADAWEIRSLSKTTLKFVPLLGRAADERLMSRQDWISRLTVTSRREFDWICVDMPALAQCGDALAIVNSLDHLVIVAEWNRTNLADLALSLKLLEPQRSKVLGVVLNKVGRRKMTLLD